MILLGLRTAYKEDPKASAAEFLYGAPLMIPGEFFLAEDTPDDHTFFYNEFREHMRNVRPVHASHHCEPKVFVFKDLVSCSHVFLRVEGMKGSLVDPYTGPHAIIKRLNDRNFVIDIDGRHVNVGIKRLRPAYLPNPELAGEPPLSTSTLPQGSSQSPGSTSTVTDNSGTSRDDSVRRESRETKAQPSPSVEQIKAEHNYTTTSDSFDHANRVSLGIIGIRGVHTLARCSHVIFADWLRQREIIICVYAFMSERVSSAPFFLSGSKSECTWIKLKIQQNNLCINERTFEKWSVTNHKKKVSYLCRVS